jgi:ABC-type methionine transport system ATPase subunit
MATTSALIRNWRIGFVFQQFNLLARSTALANVALPLVYAGLSGRERTERARRMLELVGLGERLHHKPTELSGGQQQRVALARALVNEPAIVLADEPTGNLDSKTGEEIMSLFWQLHEEQGITLIIVPHDPEVAEQTERVITLRDGLVVADEHNGHNVVYRRQRHVSELAEPPAEFAAESGEHEAAQVGLPVDHQPESTLLAQASAEEVARQIAAEAPSNGTETQAAREEDHEPGN